jgi:tRNA-dihydrouridine synthase B
LNYVRELYRVTCPTAMRAEVQVQKMKKYMNYLGLGVEPSGKFLHDIRRVTTESEFFRVCAEHLDHDRPLPLEPFALALKETDVMAGEHL